MLLKSVYDKDFPIIYPDEYQVHPNAVLLDTREKEEFDVSHLKGAQWVGFETFTLDSVRDFSKDQHLVVYCSIGARSQEIGKKLQTAGFKNVYNLYGGIFHWINEEKPVYINGSETNKIHVYSKSWRIWVNNGEKIY